VDISETCVLICGLTLLSTRYHFTLRSLHLNSWLLQWRRSSGCCYSTCTCKLMYFLYLFLYSVIYLFSFIFFTGTIYSADRSIHNLLYWYITKFTTITLLTKYTALLSCFNFTVNQPTCRLSLSNYAQERKSGQSECEAYVGGWWGLLAKQGRRKERLEIKKFLPLLLPSY